MINNILMMLSHNPRMNSRKYIRNINSSEQGKILKEPLWKEFLKVPSPAYKTTHSSGKAWVLTSTSFLDNLAEKEKKKREHRKNAV